MRTPARNNPRRDAVVEAFQLALGIKRPETARQQLMQLPRRACAAIMAYRVHGTPERYQSYVAPIESLLSAVRPTGPLTASMLVSEQSADGAEDVAETAFQANPSRATAEAFVRAIDCHMARAQLVRAAVVQQWLS